MNEITKLISMIILNRNLYKFLLLLGINIIIFSLALLNIKNEPNFTVFLSISILLTVNFIYLYILSFRILYEITSVNQYKKDINFPLFFFRVTVYQFFIGILFLIPSYFFLESGDLFNSKQKLYLLAKNEFIKTLILQEGFLIINMIGLVILIGTRSFNYFIIKLKILLSTKLFKAFIFIQLFSWMTIFTNPIDFLSSTILIILFRIIETIILFGLAIIFLLLIKEFQRNYFSEIDLL